MSKMTEKFSNQNLVNLAKQQHVQEQYNKVPSEIVTLTSKGKVYPKDHILRSGQVEMRYMTAYDEDILTNPSYINQGIVLDKLLESLIITKIKFSDIAQVDKDSLILSARLLSYGAMYPVSVIDPNTKKTINTEIDLSKLTTQTLDIDSDDNGEFEYSFNDIVLKWKFPTIADDISEMSISKYLALIITQVNNSRKQLDIDNFIQYHFLVKDSKDFQNYILNNTPKTILEYEFEGENGSAFTAGFPIGPDFFWP
jgi:hypothetical protein